MIWCPDKRAVNIGQPDWLRTFEAQFARSAGCCANSELLVCGNRKVYPVAEKTMCVPDQPCHPDVRGYHAGSDIPNYWAYASNFVLQDHMFAAAGPGACPLTCTRCLGGQPSARIRMVR